jgi:hypothetical protein
MNICDCPDPPGGDLKCPDDQLAICGYQNGKNASGCYERPAYVRLLTTIRDFDDPGTPRLDDLVLSNWIISTITGSRRAEADPVEDRHLAMLRRGEYKNERTGEVTKFSLPRSIHAESWGLELPLQSGYADLEWRRPDAVEEAALTPWMKSVAEVSRRVRQVKDLAKLNRALADLKAWTEHFLSLNKPEASRMIADVNRDLSRALEREAKGKMPRLKRWLAAGKPISPLELQRAGKDVTALWVELLRKGSV